jgi:uncharacterized protein YndB with AHSA1/START domain
MLNKEGHPLGQSRPPKADLPGKAEPITKEVILKAPIGKVWKAITDKDEMKNWYFDLAEFKPEVGFEFQFVGGDGVKSFLHLCKITMVIPGKKIAYSWRYDGYAGDSLVTFELFADGETTRLKLTHEGIENFPPDPAFARENFVNGWNQIIGTSLKEYVEKKLN